MTSLKQVTILLYVAVFSPKNKLFGEVKVKIEYHRLSLCRTCNRDSCVRQWYICQPCCLSDSLSRDCNIFKSINCVCMFPNNGHLSTNATFVIPHGWPLWTGLTVYHHLSTIFPLSFHRWVISVTFSVMYQKVVSA